MAIKEIDRDSFETVRELERYILERYISEVLRKK